MQEVKGNGKTTYILVHNSIVDLGKYNIVAYKRHLFSREQLLYSEEDEYFILHKESLLNMNSYEFLTPYQALIWCMMENVRLTEDLVNIFIHHKVYDG